MGRCTGGRLALAGLGPGHRGPSGAHAVMMMRWRGCICVLIYDSCTMMEDLVPDEEDDDEDDAEKLIMAV